MIELSNITLRYAKSIILSEVDLQIAKGQLISLIGKSGSGKSTLLYILGGLLKPSQGSYSFNGKTVYGLKEFGLGSFRKKNIGFVFQDFRLLSFLTVQQNIRLPLLFSGSKIQKKEVTLLMERLQIAHRRKAYPADISGGEAQRTAIARSLIQNPKLLLLDEPTGNLDLKTEKEILDLMLEIREQGITLVCATHSSVIINNSDKVFQVENKSISELKSSSKSKVSKTKKTVNKTKKKSRLK